MEDSCHHSNMLLGVMQQALTYQQQQLKPAPQQSIAILLPPHRIRTNSS
jgi:hypothetical protein